MKTFNAVILLLILLNILLSCNDVPKEPYQHPPNAVKLLAGTQGKTWKLAKRLNGGTRMNMGDCFLSYRISYHPDNTLSDNNGDQYDCGETLKATWKFFKNKRGYTFLKVESDQLPKLMNIKDNHTYFQLLNLTDSTLTITFKHKQFSNKTMWITDYLVPEDIRVEGRDFHNR